MQGILTAMTTTLNGTNYLFPIDSSVTPNDIGKLMMNDGTGLAKVYQLSGAQLQQAGLWAIAPGSLNNFGSAQITITTAGNSYTYSQSDWDQYFPVAETLAEELSYLRQFLQSQPTLGSLIDFYQSTDGNTLYIQESSFQGTIVYVNGMGNFPLTVVRDSLATLPPLPMYFPLGKLLGICDNQALIDCNMIGTYTLQQPSSGGGGSGSGSGSSLGNFVVNNGLFSYASDLNITSKQGIYNLLSHIMVPAANGAVTPFDLSVIDFGNNNAEFLLKYQFVGFALSATPYTVTVYNVSYLSFFLSLVLKSVIEGVLQIGSNNDNPYVPPIGSGSGSGLI
jgi:hypothetical protein